MGIYLFSIIYLVSIRFFLQIKRHQVDFQGFFIWRSPKIRPIPVRHAFSNLIVKLLPTEWAPWGAPVTHTTRDGLRSSVTKWSSSVETAAWPKSSSRAIRRYRNGSFPYQNCGQKEITDLLIGLVFCSQRKTEIPLKNGYWRN